MPPYLQEIVLPQLREINRTAGPVPGTRFAQLIGQPERTVRYWLAVMERAGAVHRPRGTRSGWVVRAKE